MLHDGENVEIKHVLPQKRQTQVYNFEVDGNHNYFVSAARVLVHNCEIPAWKGPADYSHLKDGKSVAPEKNFTQAQKKQVLEANKKHNDGYLRSDLDGTILEAPTVNKKGISLNMF